MKEKNKKNIYLEQNFNEYKAEKNLNEIRRLRQEVEAFHLSIFVDKTVEATIQILCDMLSLYSFQNKSEVLPLTNYKEET